MAKRKAKKPPPAPQNKSGGATAPAAQRARLCSVATTATTTTTTTIEIPSREEEFGNARTWWMVDLTQKEHLTQGATPLVVRCMRVYDWDESKARKVLKGYNQFLQIKRAQNDWKKATLLSPSADVDRMWHQHILDVFNYAHDCMLLCGNIVGHNPDGGNNMASCLARRRATKKALLETFGEEAVDVDVWGDILSSSSSSSSSSNVSGGNQSRAGGSVPAAAAAGGKAKKNDGNHHGPPITICIRNEAGEGNFFKVKRTSRLGPAFKRYAEIKSVERAKLTFKIDGEEIRDDETPELLELHDQDQLDVILKSDDDDDDDGQSQWSVEQVYITFCLRDHKGEETFFKVKKTVPFGRTFHTYTRHKGLERSKLAFKIHDEEIADNETPETLGLKDQDQVDVIMKRDGADARRPITIRVRDQTGEETFFKIRKTRKLGLVFRTYANRKGVKRSNLRFLLDGRNIDNDAETPETLELEDQDQLDVMLEQGGC